MRGEEGAGRSGACGPAPGRSARRLKVAALLTLGAAAAFLALSGAAAAHHANPTCQAGGYTQTWIGPTTFSNPSNISVFTDECILVHGDIILPTGYRADFRDTTLTFANNISGNSTVHIGLNAIWKMGDTDGNPATAADRSGLLVLNQSNLTRGFFFDASENSSVYINDTMIVGGGLPGQGLTNLSGMYFASLNDFAWNYIDHTTWANGLLLVNFSKPRTSTSYTVTTGAPPSPGAYGLYLSLVGNHTFDFLTTRQLSNGALINDSNNLTFTNFVSTASAAGLTANRVTDILIEDMTDNAHHAVAVDLNLVLNATIRRGTFSPAIALASLFGVQLDTARNVTIVDTLIANHASADLHIQLNTQNLWVENVTLRGNAAVGSKGIWADERATVFRLSNFTFRRVTIANRGEGVNFSQVGLANFDNSSISTGPVTGTGLACYSCFDLAFRDGLIENFGTGVYLSGDNLTLERLNITRNTNVGLLIGPSSFTVESVAFTSNGASIRSAGAPRIGASTIANSSIPAGVGTQANDAVVLSGADTLLSTRLMVFHNTFVNQNSQPYWIAAMRLSTFGRIDVVNNTFIGLPLNVSDAGTLVTSGNTYRISLLPLGAVVIAFERGSSLDVARETFTAPTPPLGIGTVVRAPLLSLQATVADMRLPAAEFGVWVSVDPSSALIASVTLSNLTAYATRDAFVTSGITTVAIDNVTVDKAVNAVLIVGGGTSQDLALRNAFLTASGTAVNITADSQGRVLVTNLTINRSGALPTRVLSLQGGSTVTVSRIALDGLPVGIVASDTRRFILSDQNFTDNQVGLRMDAPGATSVVLNWTITSAAHVVNSSLRFAGDITVVGVPFTLSGSTVSIFALTSDPRNSHFYFQGGATIALFGGVSIVTEPGTGGRIQDSRFTMELSPSARMTLNPSASDPPALLEGLGDPLSQVSSQQGLFFQAEGATINNVQFVNGTRPLLAAGVDLFVINCTFTSASGGLAVATVWAGGSVHLSRSSVAFHDGVEAVGADAVIDNTTFSNVGIVLSISSGTGLIEDSTVQYATAVVDAANASQVCVVRVTVFDIFQGTFIADSDSDLCVLNSYLDGDAGVFDAVAHNGATVTFFNTYVDRFVSDRRQYNADTSPNGTFTAYWDFQLAVCVLSDRSHPAGAAVNVTGPDGAIIFNGATLADGLSSPLHFLEFESHDGVGTYHVPFTMDVHIGALSAFEQVLYRNTTVIEICLDDVPPEIRIISACPLLTASELCEISASVRDEDSALAPGSPCFSFNGGPCVPKGSSLPHESWAGLFSFVLVEGNNSWCIEARDLYGNTARTCQGPVLDRVGPEVIDCDPGNVTKVRNATVELTCHFSGSPTGASFSRIREDSKHLDLATGTFTASLTLHDGVNAFDLIANDSLNNLNKVVFAWTLDTSAPTIALTTDLSRAVNGTRLVLKGTVPSDTQRITFNGVSIPVIGGQFNYVWEVPLEGVNNGTFYAVDDIGNEVTLEIAVTRDTTTNCSIVTPEKGSQTGDSPVLVAGHCDEDVTLRVNNLPVPVALDGSWSARVNLAAGSNTIEISGRDSNGATWYDELRVYYVAGAGPSGAGFLVIFALLAAGVLGAAFYISRRPRERSKEPEHRPATGAQKAPPRPKPMTVKLPETPEDMTFRPKPPGSQ